VLLIRSKLLRSTLFKISTSLFTLFFCPVFDPGEENKFSYTDIHNEYRKLVEDMLEGFSSDFHISPEQFVAMCDHGLSTGTFDEKLFESIFAADDFLMFKSIMVKRNIDLDLQAIELLKTRVRAEVVGQTSPPSYASIAPEEVEPRTQLQQQQDQRQQEQLQQEQLEQQQQEQQQLDHYPQQQQQEQQKQEDDDEDKILQAVIEQSKLEYQSKTSELNSHEIDEMLEAAKRESAHLYEMKQLEEEQMARHLQMALIMSEEEAAKLDQEKQSGSGGQTNQKESSEDKKELPQDGVFGQVEGANKGELHEQPGVQSLQTSSLKVENPPTTLHTLPPLGHGGPPTSGVEVTKTTVHSEKSLWEVCLETSPGNDRELPAGTQDQKGRDESLLHQTRAPETENTWLASAKKEALAQALDRSGEETGTPEEQVDSDPEKRAVYWKMQRDKLLALKQEHREKYIERAMAEQEEKRPMTAAMAKRVVGNPSSLDTKDPSSSSEETNDEKEEKRKTLLKALAQRLKKDLAENLADSS
jgi:hypothetical protein